ncbi:carbohydrate kinase family protein [Tianweitania sp. BSSL-BM11]|uniref:Carbohydrate kinase family protein n=1 Tax=Tianweitania aestuarii TaxID=2814886 RepID=A0ABS5RY00_9HYPH|nr:carbohydrate kinase family protein [Tianweitania aestuarii]MBS9721926.1 carbohydrate kinase family protein [Tianweitania aestuarii]
MTTPALLVLGNANVDLVLGEVDGWPAIGTEVVVQRSEQRAGGSAGNTALALTGLRVPHRFIASTGTDPNGLWLRAQFDGQSSVWINDAADTTLTVGIVHKGGDRVFFTTPGHLQSARLEDLTAHIPEAPHSQAHAILSGNFLMPAIAAGTVALLDQLKTKNWRTAIDPGWPVEGWTAANRASFQTWLQTADIALINAEEAKGFTGLDDLDVAAETLAKTLQAHQRLVIKRGPDGASAYTRDTVVHVPAPDVTVIDTVGAGDTFNAAFLAALSENNTIQAALEHGVETAARAISTFPRRYA